MHTLANDGAKIRTFCEVAKLFFAMWLFCRIFAADYDAGRDRYNVHAAVLAAGRQRAGACEAQPLGGVCGRQ